MELDGLGWRRGTRATREGTRPCKDHVAVVLGDYEA